jgi:RNA-directed DNA polymerase
MVMNKPNSDSQQNTEGWKTINWRQVERYVFKLQKRIYAASRRGDVKLVRKLQKTLMRSWSNRVLAVRRVTVENQGKKTAGVDGIKSLSPAARLKLTEQLKLTGKSKPTRRVWIPKPGRDEKRPLGIPTMYDRALQAVIKAALEPEWEAVFEPNSYGFRPGRSCHDAIKQIKNCIQGEAKFVLDADIAKCFDRINHQTLLQKLNIKGKVRRQIKAWLKSGVIDQGAFTATSEGTPQGGVISPLLANVALHGLEEALKQFAETLDIRYPGGTRRSYRDKRQSLAVIRYADDFVILHKDKAVIISCSSTDYVKVKGDKSPFDDDSVYWSSRLGKHPEMSSRKTKLLKQQKGQCPWCELRFQEWDVMEVDHKIPIALGGKDEWKNLQLLHRHCHDEKTASDGSLKSCSDKGNTLSSRVR